MRSHVERPGVNPLCRGCLCDNNIGLILARMNMCKHLAQHKNVSVITRKRTRQSQVLNEQCLQHGTLTLLSSYYHEVIFRRNHLTELNSRLLSVGNRKPGRMKWWWQRLSDHSTEVDVASIGHCPDRLRANRNVYQLLFTLIYTTTAAMCD